MALSSADGTVYEVEGPDSAPPMVLIHGLGLNRDVWQWQRPALTTSYRVISYDLFGHGETVRPPSTPSLKLFSDQLARLLDTCKIKAAAVIGLSLGGMIARRFAQDHPGGVSALGILNSPHRRSPEAQEAIVKRVEHARHEGSAATVEAALKRWFSDAFRSANPEMMDLVRRWVLANGSAVYHTLYEVLASGIDEIVAPSPPIAAPTLVITGDEDFGNGPEISHAIAAEIAGAEVVILKGLRHMALAEDPPAVNGPLLAFFEKTIGRTSRHD